ncbi:MAG: peptidylprolyl isomerase [Anaerolineaceae bacterium]|nr:peptidylprolyl isomerase [Anaerolineaceae bacterium]
MFPKPSTLRFILFLTVGFSALFWAGCSGAPPTSSPTGTTALPTAVLVSATPPLPTPTHEPAAAIVDGQDISLADYAAELSRYQAAQTALKATPPPDAGRQAVLDMLVDRMLLAQAATEAGFQVDDAAIQAREGQMATQLGGEKALSDWEAAHDYTADSFRAALKLEAAAAYERDQIAAQVPSVAEQVHVRQILVADEAAVQKVQERLRSGTEFATLASTYDPITGGDLGWFPKGYLPDAKIEEAAFALKPGEVSPVIQNGAGFHLIQLIELDPQRLLNSDQRLALQQKAIENWLVDRRAQHRIEILIP